MRNWYQDQTRLSTGCGRERGDHTARRMGNSSCTAWHASRRAAANGLDGRPAQRGGSHDAERGASVKIEASSPPFGWTMHPFGIHFRVGIRRLFTAFGPPVFWLVVFARTDTSPKGSSFMLRRWSGLTVALATGVEGRDRRQASPPSHWGSSKSPVAPRDRRPRSFPALRRLSRLDRQEPANWFPCRPPGRDADALKRRQCRRHLAVRRRHDIE